MEKSRQELIDNYKTEQRAIKVRKALTKTKEWGENLLALLFVLAMGLVVIMICVSLWKLGLGFNIILAGFALLAVIIWLLVDYWVDNEQEKARQRWNKAMREEN